MTKLIIAIVLSIFTFVFGQNKKAVSLPEKDFEKFWTTFQEDCAFFELKQVNWDDAYTQYRRQFTPKTSREELLNALGKMVDPLQDGHITISKEDDVVYFISLIPHLTHFIRLQYLEGTPFFLNQSFIFKFS